MRALIIFTIFVGAVRCVRAQVGHESDAILVILPPDVQSVVVGRSYQLVPARFQNQPNTLEGNVTDLQGLSAGELAPAFADAITGLNVRYAATGFRKMRKVPNLDLRTASLITVLICESKISPHRFSRSRFKSLHDGQIQYWMLAGAKDELAEFRWTILGGNKLIYATDLEGWDSLLRHLRSKPEEPALRFDKELWSEVDKDADAWGIRQFTDESSSDFTSPRHRDSLNRPNPNLAPGFYDPNSIAYLYAAKKQPPSITLRFLFAKESRATLPASLLERLGGHMEVGPASELVIELKEGALSKSRLGIAGYSRRMMGWVVPAQ